MTKEYFPSLTGSHTDFRDFATLSIDPPGHGFSYLNGSILSAESIDQLMKEVINWLEEDSRHDFSIGNIGVLGNILGGKFLSRIHSRIIDQDTSNFRWSI